MIKKSHMGHSQKWESSPKDSESKSYGMEGSRKEEAMDRRQAKMAMPPRKK